MTTTIKLKNSTVASAMPTALALGEIAINVTDQKMWVGNSALTPVLMLETDVGNTPFEVKGNTASSAEIRLFEDTDNGSNYISLKAASNLSASFTLTLPSTDGTNNQAIVTNGSGSLSFADLDSTSDFIHLATFTASNSTTVDVEGYIDGTYPNYVIVGSKLEVDTGASDVQCRLKIGGTYATTNYSYHVAGPTSGATTYNAAAAESAASIKVVRAVDPGAANSVNFFMTIASPSNTTAYKSVYWYGDSSSGQAQLPAFGSGKLYNSTSALTGVRFFANTGNLLSGNFYLYGVKA